VETSENVADEEKDDTMFWGRFHKSIFHPSNVECDLEKEPTNPSGSS